MKFHKSFYFWVLLILLVFGSLVRFYNLGEIVLNRDEPLHTVRVCYQSFSFVRAFNQSSAFFSLLVHSLLPLGKVEFMSRLPSVFFGVLCILMVFFLGKLFFSKREGLLAGVFVAVSPYFIIYSQYSRAYMAYAFFAMLSLYFFIKAVNRNKWNFWLLFVLSTTLLFYTHLFSLIILPVYIFFVILMLGWEWREEKKFPLNLRLSKIYLPFFLSIVAIFLILVFLYYPDQGARNLIHSYFLDKDSSSAAASFNPLSLFKNIFYEMLYVKNYFLFWVMSGLALLGLIFGFIDKKKSLLLITGSILIPFLLFSFSGPRERDLASVTRYFIFFLPLFFICLAKGINKISSLVSENLWRKKQIPSLKNLFYGFFVIGFSVLAVFTFNFKNYYLNALRYQSFNVDKKVHDFLKEELKHDAYIFFNTSPARYLNLIASPLTKKISPNEIPIIYRPSLHELKKSNEFMIYRIRDVLMERINFFDMETWVVVKAEPEWIERLVNSAQMVPEADLSVINDYILIRLGEGFGSVSEKMQLLISILQSSKPPEAEKKFLHIASARFSILEGKVSKARRELKKAKAGQNIYEDYKISYTPFLFKILDRCFFESQDELEKIFEDLYVHHLASLFFQTGNAHYGKKNFMEANRAYRVAAELDKDLLIPVAKRYEGMGHYYLTQGKVKKAVKAYKEALKLDSSLLFLNISLAESYFKSGQIREAEKALCQGLSVDKLPEVISRWIGADKPFILVWKKESKWNLIVHSQNRTSYSGRIIDIEDVDGLESFQFRKKDTLLAENGEIKFVLERSKRKFRGFQFKSKDKRFDLEFYVNGDPAEDKIIFLDIHGPAVQLKN